MKLFLVAFALIVISYQLDGMTIIILLLSFNMYVSISAAPTKEDSDTDQELLKLLKDAWMEHQVAG